MIKILGIFFFLFSSATFSYERVVSTVPSITEILISLGLEEKVIGVSRYCFFDNDVCKKNKIGTSIDLNYEKILTLRPDLVLLSASTKTSSISSFSNMKIKVVSIKHERLEDIFEAINILAKEFKVQSRGKELIQKMNSDLERVEPLKGKIKILLVIGASIKGGEVLSAHVAGSDNFYNDIFVKMGITNIFENSNIAYPQLDRERLLMNEVDYVVEIFDKVTPAKLQSSKEAWEKMFKKMKTPTRYISLVGDYLFIPGPRVGRIAKELFNQMGLVNVKGK
ncbi:ABC transporter substrate-binding protein [Halobacteriovorax sp. HLS]|uniref:ABC transporter substrate-binding protein n=1 Tax=Halobacteriovorax sp. HLS TaxID=2234000 RepID=UPI000FD78560|nr:helical backbone metal receptor [Halobacteriovorax sp. HLS]